MFPATDADNSESNATHVAVLGVQLEAERARIALLEQNNDDLRRRLDASEAESRNVQPQLAALLVLAGLTKPADSERSCLLGRRIPGWIGRQHRL